jgi:hypothetical protein
MDKAMRKFVSTCLLALMATQATAQTSQPAYSDNRSSPAEVVRSLYNAVNRHEYLRGWSYFRPETAPDYKNFAAGYSDTDHVEIRLGKVMSDGAAGSIHSQVPVALRATGTDGRTTVFEGCYLLTQVQPAVQETPPFRPIMIDSGHLQKSSRSFAQATGSCT